MYAIVDIETTGGHASANGITEIAVVLHDGIRITERFETLVNPGVEIPVYIRALTGISNEMVYEAPPFAAVAERIYSLLQNRIFIAHNVNFDYSFLRHHLAAAGYQLQCKKLCTVRLGRKIFPGLPSYSLGRFTRSMGIEIENRHRAMGDAEATATLFSMMLREQDSDQHINAMLNQRSKEQSLPPNLAKQQVDQLPMTPGVYYFHNQKGKVIYVGKAKNLKKRVCSHFQNNSAGRQKQEFLRHIHNITFQECGTELMALILESVEIKRLWPENNRALKQFGHNWGLYLFEDQNGYLRMAIDRRRKYSVPAYTFGSLLDGNGILRTLMKEFDLCPKLCFIQKNNDPCSGKCNGACTGEEAAPTYNDRVHSAISYLKSAMPTYAIVDQGRTLAEKSFILVESGQFYGMGYLSEDHVSADLVTLKNSLTPYPDTDYIKNMVYQYANRYPERKRNF